MGIGNLDCTIVMVVVLGYVTGRLSSGLLVHFPGTEDLIGKIVNVKLNEAKGFYYMGEMIN